MMNSMQGPLPEEEAARIISRAVEFTTQEEIQRLNKSPDEAAPLCEEQFAIPLEAVIDAGVEVGISREIMERALRESEERREILADKADARKRLKLPSNASQGRVADETVLRQEVDLLLDKLDRIVDKIGQEGAQIVDCNLRTRDTKFWRNIPLNDYPCTTRADAEEWSFFKRVFSPRKAKELVLTSPALIDLDEKLAPLGLGVYIGRPSFYDGFRLGIKDKRGILVAPNSWRNPF